MSRANRQTGSRSTSTPDKPGRPTELVAEQGPAGLLVSRLHEHLPAILADEPVQLAYLVGSSVTGHTTPFSDVDVALVAGTTLQPFTRLQLILRVRLALADRCGIEADVRVIDDAPLVFRGRVVSDGVLVFARAENVAIATSRPPSCQAPWTSNWPSLPSFNLPSPPFSLAFSPFLPPIRTSFPNCPNLPRFYPSDPKICAILGIGK